LRHASIPALLITLIQLRLASLALGKAAYPSPIKGEGLEGMLASGLELLHKQADLDG
jgi:hypothetical protein